MNQIATIEIELLSEAVLGGNSKLATTVDIDIQTDEYGFPYYSGRTLKGVLREQAEWYINCLSQFHDIAKYKESLGRLFGFPDSADRSIHSQNYTCLRFSDAKLSKQLYDFVQENRLDPQEVLSSITKVRTMTSIDGDTGVAKTGSLRQIRVVLPGYKLYAPIYVQGLLSEEDRELLETSVKLVRHIGIMRNRGKGSVRCKLHWHDQIQPNYVEAMCTSSTKQIEEPRYIILTINAHEPLKISQVLGTSDSTHALNYIPGYVIRGALVQAYLQSTGVTSDDLDTSIIFDHRNVQFWNGYLAINGRRSLPFVQHLFERKERSKERFGDRLRRVYNAFNEEEMRLIRTKSPVRVNRDMMLLEEERLIGSRVRKTSSMHISVNGNRNQSLQKVQIYRYEAIAPEQTFIAVVSVKKNDPFVNWLSDQKELTLWLGGARNSGYGRCSVKLSVSKNHPEQPLHQFNETAKIDELYIIATSDWIIRNEQGQLTSSLDEHWLGEQLGASVRLEDQVVNTKITGGYISKWQAYQPMIRAVQAGSIFRYTVQAGTVDIEKLQSLVQRGVGSRRNEGFGRLMILPNWIYSNLVDQTALDQVISTNDHRYLEQDNSQLLKFEKTYVSHKLTNLIRREVASWLKQLEGKEYLSSSQWGKLLQFTSQLAHQSKKGLNSEDVQQQWNQFWDDIDRRATNKWKIGYDGVRISNKKLRDFVSELLQYRWKMDEPYHQRVFIQHEQWSLQALELFFRQIVRSKVKAREEVN